MENEGAFIVSQPSRPTVRESLERGDFLPLRPEAKLEVTEARTGEE
jgi:hypothetical protein